MSGGLREAGARHIVVFNLPDPGATPFARLAALHDPQAPAALTGLANLYNGELDAGLRSLGTGIVPINVFALLGEAIRNPATYGFTNVQARPVPQSDRTGIHSPAVPPAPAYR